MAESGPAMKSNSIEQTFEEGSHSEWPPTPPIGQLKSEQLNLPSGNGERELSLLRNILKRRWGLSTNNAFKKIPNSEIWTERELLKVALLSLEGWSNLKIAETFDDENDPDRIVSENLVSQVRINYFTNFLNKTIESNKKKAVKWHSILHPEKRSTEEKIQKLEQYFRLSRTQIFKHEGVIPGGSGIYQTDIAIAVLFDVLINKLSSSIVAEKTASVSLRKKDKQRLTSKDVNLLFFNILSKDAKRILKEKRSTRRVSETWDSTAESSSKAA